jgi:protein-L-isoaspartate O-methyltransferase
MGTISFDNFGKLATAQLSATERAGRYRIQAEAEKLIVADIVAKLALKPDDDLLEIGCGSGLLLVLLSFVVRSATGIDHPAVTEVLRRSFSGAPIHTIDGNFLNAEIEATFSAIVIYGVAISLLERGVVCVRRQGLPSSGAGRPIAVG